MSDTETENSSCGWTGPQVGTEDLGREIQLPKQWIVREITRCINQRPLPPATFGFLVRDSYLPKTRWPDEPGYSCYKFNVSGHRKMMGKGRKWFWRNQERLPNTSTLLTIYLFISILEVVGFERKNSCLLGSFYHLIHALIPAFTFKVSCYRIWRVIYCSYFTTLKTD